MCDIPVYAVDYVLLPTTSARALPAYEEPQEVQPAPPPAPVCDPGATAYSAMAARPELAVFLHALKTQPDVLDQALDPNAYITLFAPTNDAFKALADEMRTNVKALVSQDSPLVSAILRHHIVGGTIRGQDLQSFGYTTFNGTSPIYVKTDASGREIVQSLGADANLVATDVDASCQTPVHMIDNVMLPFHINTVVPPPKQPEEDTWGYRRRLF